MSTIKIPEAINHDRRSFLGMAAMTAAAAKLGVSASLDAHGRGANTSAASTKPVSEKACCGPSCCAS